MQRDPHILAPSAPSIALAFLSPERPLGFTGSRVGSLIVCAAVVASLLVISIADMAAAQGWEDEDDWSSTSEDYPTDRGTTNAPYTSSYAATNPAISPWAIRAGIGFTRDPHNFLMNFEIPYAFDSYVSLGPMVQVGIEDGRLLVAPTANLTLSIPNMPGTDFDRWHPNVFVGIGFAVIENDDRGGDNSSAGFLVNTGVGLDYELSPRVSLGSRMIFNFLPEKTLDEKFFYSWEVLGVKLTF